MPDNSAVERIIEKYGDMLYRLCLIMLCVPADPHLALRVGLQRLKMLV